ncbi:MAG TPA: hypothetical protein VIH31_01325 [Candidatus Paceibacterota bacterium]
MKKFFQNPKKNSDLRKKIGTIGTKSANMTLDNILMIFLLQDCSEEVFDTRKTKIEFWTEKTRTSSSFVHRVEKPDVLTVDVFSVIKEGHDFNSLKDALKITKKENHPIIALLLTDAKKLSASKEDQQIFGKTLGDILREVMEKHGANSEQLYTAARAALVERKRAIAKCLTEFDGKHSSEKGIATKESALSFASLRSKSDINLIHLIGHKALDVDIIFQRHIHENVITAGERTQKFIPAILKKLRSIEPTTWLEKDGTIYSEPTRHTLISYENMRNVIEKAIREFEPAKTETIQKNGNGMPSDAMHHTPSLLPNSEAYREAPAIA